MQIELGIQKQESPVHNWTDKQKAIFDAIASGTSNIIVEACAGGAKTSTIVEATKYIPKGKTILFCAFNKSIAEELGNRLPSNCSASTLHSLGYSAMRSMGYAKVNGRKTSNILQYDLVDMENKEQAAWYWENNREICRFISILKSTAQEYTKAEVEKLAFEFGLEDCFYLSSFLYPLYARSIEFTGKKGGCVIDYEDMLRIPVVRRCTFQAYDYIFVDEAQDLSEIQREMLALMLASGGRLVAVGDRKQAIYGFRGADYYSLDYIKEKFNCIAYPLDTTFRCSWPIVHEANRLYTDIYALDTNSTGGIFNITEATFPYKVRSKDMVLCRINAPLVSAAYTAVKSGQKVCVMGNDIGDSLVALAKKILKHYSLVSFNTSRCQTFCAEKEATLSKTAAAKLIDLCWALSSILEGQTNTIQSVKATVDKLFVSTPTPDSILFSSIHKAKGLEAERVFLLSPDLLPHYLAETPEEIMQEKNLLYVAITRAKKEFYYVEGKPDFDTLNGKEKE